MHIAQRVQKLVQRRDQRLARQARGGALQRLQKVGAVDMLHRHIGGLVVLEDLVDLHDVRMVQLGQVQRLLLEKRDERAELLLALARAGADVLARAAAEGRGEAFLHHHPAIQRIARPVGDPEPARVQEGVDGELAQKQPRAGLQLVGEMLDPRFVVDPKRSQAHAFTRRRDPAPSPGAFAAISHGYRQSWAKS